MENTWKRILLFPLHINSSLNKAWKLCYAIEGQSVEAWQNEKHYSKENNASENPMPRQEIFKSVDHVKYEDQVTTFAVCAVFSLTFQAVVLKSVLKLHVQFCFIASLIARMHGKVRSCLKARGSYNQLQNNHINYEFN